MRAWNELSMAEKADVMKLAIEGGVYDLDSIRNGYNEFAKGGSIHIKPENRGKFTRLKERTGHSATWFKEHGTPAQKKMATFALNARHWKHGDGGELDVYDEPQTFAGRVVEAVGASPSIVRGADVVSSVAQMTPWGHYIAATDLGRDLNRVYHKEKGAKKDVALDLLSMIPGISAPGLKAAENTWNTIRGNNKLRKALNTGIITGRVADFVDDTWGADKTSKAYGGNIYWPGGKVSDVDTRSDTTRAGFHDGTPTYGAVDASNTAGLGDLLNYNITGNKHIITGEPIIPIMGKMPSSNITKNLLKMIGKSSRRKPQKPLSEANIGNLAAEDYGNRYPGIEKQIELFRENGVDLSKIGVEDIDDILKSRRANITESAPSRYTVASPSGQGYILNDYINGNHVGRTDVSIDNVGNAHMENIHNLTEHLSLTDPKRAHGVQRRGLNSAIAVAKSEGGDGVITGSLLQSAPKQYPAIFEHPEREVISNGGFHTNENMVEPGEYGMFGGMEGPTKASSVEEMWANGSQKAMELAPAPVWKLTKQTEFTPTKSEAFNPTIIDENGIMHTDWNALDIFKGLAFPVTVSATATKKIKNDRKTKK